MRRPAVPDLLLPFYLLLASASPVLAAEGGELPRIVNFAIVAAILVWFLRKPLAGYLNAKTQQIREQLEDAKSKQARAQVERKRAEELLASLDQEVQRAREESRRAADLESERILRSAEQEAARIREMARKEIDAQVESGRRQLLARATELSVDLAQKKLQSTMTEKDQRNLVDRSIEILKERA